MGGFPRLLDWRFFLCYRFYTRFHTLTYLSILLLIFGLLLFMIGWDLTRELLVPLLFLAFMFPVPSAYYVLITNPLKLFITKMSVNIISLIGIPVYREGNLLRDFTEIKLPVSTERPQYRRAGLICVG